MAKRKAENIDQLIRAAFEKKDLKKAFFVWEKFARDIAQRHAEKTDYPNKDEIIVFIYDGFLKKAEKKWEIRKPRTFIRQIVRSEYYNFFRDKIREEKSLKKLINIYKILPPEDLRKEISRKIVLETVKKITKKFNKEERIIVKALMGKVKAKEVAVLMNLTNRKVYSRMHLVIRKIRKKIFQLAEKDPEFREIIIKGFGSKGFEKLTLY